MSSSLFIGRWQPFHDGHKALIQKVLDEGKSVVIAIRDTEISDKNPYSVEERMKVIADFYQGNDSVQIITIPDIDEVCYGRDVGWGMRRIHHGDTEFISATEIRKNKQ